MLLVARHRLNVRGSHGRRRYEPLKIMVLWLAMAALLAGCGPHLSQLRVDPQLDYAQLQAGKLAALPATAAGESPKRGDLSSLNQLLLKTIAAERAALEVVNDDAALLAEGGVSSGDVADSHAFQGKVPIEQAAALASKLGVRFLILTHVLDNKVTHSSGSDTSADLDTETHFRSTTRKLTIRLVLFDAGRRAIVWEGTASRFKRNQLDSSTTHESPATQLLDRAVGYTKVATAPPAPPFNEVADETLDALVSSWPD